MKGEQNMWSILPNSSLELDQLLMQDNKLCSKVDTVKYEKGKRILKI